MKSHKYLWFLKNLYVLEEGNKIIDTYFKLKLFLFFLIMELPTKFFAVPWNASNILLNQQIYVGLWFYLTAAKIVKFKFTWRVSLRPSSQVQTTPRSLHLFLYPVSWISALVRNGTVYIFVAVRTIFKRFKKIHNHPTCLNVKIMCTKQNSLSRLNATMVSWNLFESRCTLRENWKVQSGDAKKIFFSSMASIVAAKKNQMP